MRRYRRPDRQILRIGNVLPEVTGELDTRRRERDPGRETDQHATYAVYTITSY